MPEAQAVVIDPRRQRLDRQLLLSVILPALAAGISTIVGYTVAHWITIIAYKRTGYLVSLLCFALCAAAASLAWRARRKLAGHDEVSPEDGRRLFMAKLGLLLSALCALVVLAGTLVLVTLRPSD